MNIIKFYSSDQVCDIINHDLKLEDKEKINPFTLTWWLRKKVIEKDPNSRYGRYTTDHINKIKEVAFIHCVLGVQLSKIKSTQEYFAKHKIKLKYG